MCKAMLLSASPFSRRLLIVTRHTHSVNASCSYEVHEDIICTHTNGSLEDVARVIVHMACQKIQSNYGISAYI